MYEIQTDMLLKPLFDPHETDKEREVVLAEIDRSLDSPQNQFYYACMEETYGNHPYRHPVLGYKNIIETVPVDTIRNYYNSHYHPTVMNLLRRKSYNQYRLRSILFQGIARQSGCQ